MEITIDTARVRAILADEYERAREEIATTGPVSALKASQARHDTRLAAASDAKLLACKAGCFWCCYFTVDVRPVEVFAILEAMQQLTEAERTRVEKEIRANSVMLAPLDDEQRMTRNIKCPFLNAGRCTIYAARPQTCRNYHATDARGCERSFEYPDDLEIDPEFAPDVYQTGAAHVDAFSNAMSEAGYDTNAYELSTALAAAMDDPVETRRRFESKQTPFPKLQGTEVTPEFADLQKKTRKP